MKKKGKTQGQRFHEMERQVHEYGTSELPHEPYATIVAHPSFRFYIERIIYLALKKFVLSFLALLLLNLASPKTS